MDIHVRDESRIVEVWLTNAEQQDAEVCGRLKPLYQEYKRKNYLVAVFQSGDQNLADVASDLLRYNRRRIAHLEVERDRQNGMVIGM